MVAESWFRSIWKIPRRHEGISEKVEIGVLAFEVASLMSKLVHLWQCLSDKQVVRLREEITNSVGIKKLVSEDEEYIGRLICAEMVENITHVSKSVSRLAKKCREPGLKSFELVFTELVQMCVDPYGWIFSSKKMDKKVKKMERFISVNATLYQEMELLADLEQTLRRMKSSDSAPENLLEFQRKVMWKQHEVKNLRANSLWNKTYDYTICLLARSIFTIFGRIKHVFGVEHSVDVGDSKVMSSDFMHRSQSVSAVMHSLVHPMENTGLPRFSSGPLGTYSTKSGPIPTPNKTNYFHLGPLGGSTTKSGSISGKNGNFNFHSGPLGRPAGRSGQLFGMNKLSQIWQTNSHSAAAIRRKSHLKNNRLTQVGPFKGCMVAVDSGAIGNCYVSSNGIHSGILNGTKDGNLNLTERNAAQSSSSVFRSQCRLLDAPAETLGASALALHYANVIIVIEKLAASPHLIGHDAREDLYNMLPASARAALRVRLKPYAKSLASSVYDMELAGEWTDAMSSILEWLAPLAHNMIRWQSERSFEQQNFVSRTNMLLVQTLYFANREKTEAAIIEILVGLNYVWRHGRELNAKALQERAGSRISDGCLDLGK
ncbi:myotubularin-like [Hibiscus syriacus]|uniref:Myotubularin-like n=1 Tax=Hibiscus syriacus TaxID=106335 RepID=A0A6A2XMV7_HIBSY|nr:protein PSK SIMULATOR 1-like [Hibiscus syriacus]KAE8676918.1 myotubularin-like [Hibiscus syriacus]